MSGRRLIPVRVDAIALRACVIALPLLAPALALAQSSTAPPQPNLRRGPAPWIGFLVMALMLGLVVAVSLMPSKRGHQK